MSIDDAIRAAQSFAAALDGRFESERAAIEAKASAAKTKLADGLLDLKESAAPRPIVEPDADRYHADGGLNGELSGAPGYSSGLVDDVSTEEPFVFEDDTIVTNGARGGAHAPHAAPAAFDHAAAPEPALDGGGLLDDEVLLDDDGIPTWQEP